MTKYTIFGKNVNEGIKLWKKLLNGKIRYRTSRYKGRGRPKKSDYVIIKRKDLPDYQAAEILQNAFTTTFFPL